MTVGFEVAEEGPDQRGVEVVEVQLVGCFAGTVVCVVDEQADGVAVGGDRLGAGIALAEEPLDEEGSQGRGAQGHDSTSPIASRRLLTSSSSSGTAWRYQYVDSGETWPR